MKFFLLIITLALLPQALFAQEEEVAISSSTNDVQTELTIGELVIAYDESSVITDGTLYYRTTETGTVLLASAHDTNDDEVIDVWIQYDENGVVTNEAHDTDGDSTPDVLISVDGDGAVREISGSKANDITAPAIESFTPDIPAGEINGDLVGDLDDISIGNNGYAPIFFIILFVVGAVVYWFLRRQKDR